MDRWMKIWKDEQMGRQKEMRKKEESGRKEG